MRQPEYRQHQARSSFLRPRSIRRRTGFSRKRPVCAALASLLIAVLLAACATTGSLEETERFRQGRAAYLAGNYAGAFERLLVEAAAGRADAQYAVGYMYYEGQGVDRDEERALYWIRRAAESGSRHAIRALGELAGMGRNRPSMPTPRDQLSTGKGPEPAPGDSAGHN